MDSRWTAVGGAGLGALLMYFFDPDRGKRRRALPSDKIIHLLHATGDTLDVTSRNVAYRTHGLVARTRSLFAPECVPDAILLERVRSAIGHVCSHPGFIEVTVRDGRVTLAGSVLAREVHRLFARVSRVRGVAGVENELEAYEEIASVPGPPGGMGERTAGVH